MKILFFGAGVLGSLYASQLCYAGHEVRILARGKRLQEIRDNGIILEHAFSGKRTGVSINVVESLNPTDRYDWIIVLVRKNQLESILPVIAANITTPNVLLMVNNPSGYVQWAKLIGKDRLVVGFAGAGGTIRDGVVKYSFAPGFLQPTTLGELDGRNSSRLVEIVRIFRQSGFPTAISKNMDAWQKTHIAWVSPLANAIYTASQAGLALHESVEILRSTVTAIREAYAVLKSLDIPITPAKLKLWQVTPTWLLVETLHIWTKSKHFNTLILEHSLTAQDEMALLTSEFSQLADAAGIVIPAYDSLARSNHFGQKMTPRRELA